MVLGWCWSLESRKFFEIFKGSWPSRFSNDNVAFVDKFRWIFCFFAIPALEMPLARQIFQASFLWLCFVLFFLFFSFLSFPFLGEPVWRHTVAWLRAIYFMIFNSFWCWTQTRRQTGLMSNAIFNAISKWLKRRVIIDYYQFFRQVSFLFTTILNKMLANHQVVARVQHLK